MKKLMAGMLAGLMLFCSGCGTQGNQTSGNDGGESTPNYPTKDITVIVPYGAGGTTDLCVRGVLDAVPAESKGGKNFIVSNVAGGSGLVGATQFATSKADGYTLGVLNCDLVLNNVLGNTDITPDQFVPLACIENDPYLLVVGESAPYQTFEEFVDYAKAHPGEIVVGDTGTGVANHQAYLALTKKLGLDLKTVAYDSAADSVVALVAGECQAVITASGSAVGQLEAGAIKAIACTSNERLSTYPDVPAMGELYEELADMQVNSWIFMAVSADADPAIIAHLQEAFGPAATSESYQQTQASFFFQPVEQMSNEEMLSFVADQQAYYESLK